MLPHFTGQCGNSLAAHTYGAAARQAIDRARGQAAGLIGAMPDEVVFTSGASEANNLAIKGAAAAHRSHKKKGGHFITQLAEHKAVLAPMHALEAAGFEVTFLRPDTRGMIHPAQVAGAIRMDTILVSIMAANNETGVINDIAAMGRACRARGVLFHTDATQFVGKLPLDVVAANVDLLSFTGHKMYGPKGCGALSVREACRERVRPLIEGGGHERGMRAGTLNTPGIIGLGEACALCAHDMVAEAARMAELRLRLERALMNAGIGAVINGHPEQRLPHITNVCFESVKGEAVFDRISQIACSAGSALCTAGDGAAPGKRAASHVLAAMGVADDLAATALRISLGRFTTAEEVDRATGHVIGMVRAMAGAPVT